MTFSRCGQRLPLFLGSGAKTLVVHDARTLIHQSRSNREGPLLELGRFPFTSGAPKKRCVVEQCDAHAGMQLTERSPIDLHRTAIQRLSQSILLPEAIQLGKIIQHHRQIRIFRRLLHFEDPEGLEKTSLRFGKVPALHMNIAETVQRSADTWIRRAEPYSPDGDRLIRQNLRLLKASESYIDRGQVVQGDADVPT